MSDGLNEYEDQAAELRKLFNEVQGNEDPSQKKAENIPQELSISHENMDILNLPPRKAVHSKKGGRAHLKVSIPFLRLLVVIIVISGVVVGLYNLWGMDAFIDLLEKR